jgi:hypothetical protein
VPRERDLTGSGGWRRLLALGLAGGWVLLPLMPALALGFWLLDLG